MSEGQKKFLSPAEEVLITFEDPKVQIGPKNRNWSKRVALEMENLKRYLDYLRNKKNALWFFLAPDKDRKYNFRVWKGKLKIPQRPDINFDLRVVLTKEYPKVFPRAFAEESIIKYAAKNLYVESRYEIDEEKSFVMICHDHMNDLSVWDPSLSMAHFLLRQILIWWNARMDTVIRLWDEDKTK